MDSIRLLIISNSLGLLLETVNRRCSRASVAYRCRSSFTLLEDFRSGMVDVGDRRVADWERRFAVVFRFRRTGDADAGREDDLL